MAMNETQLDRFSEESRVWIYQADRRLNDVETEAVKKSLKQFALSWTSHNRDLLAYADIYFNRFVVLIADETNNKAGGCSIDASVHFLKRLGQEFGLDLFDRMQFAYIDENKSIQVASRDDFIKLFESGKITAATKVFDNLVKTKKDFAESWVKPLSESWHARMV